MNAALWFLTWHLARRSLKDWLIGFRQPGRLIGLACVGGAVCSLYLYRDTNFVRDLVRSTPLSVVLVLALFLSIARGLMQRGLRFDPPDIEYVFCGPFTERSILLFRLFPSYCASVLLGAFFYLFFGGQFERPFVVSVCVCLVQILSVHLTMLASLYAGMIPESSLRTLRRGMWAFGLVMGYVFLRSVVLSNGESVPVRSPLKSLLLEVGAFPMMSVSGLVESSLRIGVSSEGLRQSVLVTREGLVAWSLGAVVALFIVGSFSQIMGFRGVVFESSVAPVSDRLCERPAHKSMLRRSALALAHLLSALCPMNGGRAIVWKNLICARRSIPRLLLALFYTLIVILPWLSIFLMMRQSGSFDPWAVNGALPLTLAALPLILQTTVPFDFRLDGPYLSELKMLPIGGLQTVLGMIAVPVCICLLFQFLGLVFFLPIVPFDRGILMAMVLGFPSVSVGVNVVWNLHYLLFARQRFSELGKPKRRTTVGALFVAGMAFAVFFPSCWMLHYLVDVVESPGWLAALLAVGTQYAIDLILIWLLARVYNRSSGLGRKKER